MFTKQTNTEVEKKLLAYLAHHLIVANSYEPEGDLAFVDDMFMKELVYKKIKRILEKPLDKHIQSIYIEVCANRFMHGEDILDREKFDKTMDIIINNK